jgi:stearoyl-CoA desaturase (Delta-9 desaturase)
MNGFILLAIHWFASLFCQSFFLHRYSSHQMFTMNKFWERFFYFCTFLLQGPSFLNPRSYALMHQKHHAYSDSDIDPHSPHYSKNVIQMMFKTYGYYQKLVLESLQQTQNDGMVPVWPWLDKFAVSRTNIIAWIFIYPAIYYFFNVSVVYYLLLPIHFFVGPIQGAIVNWCGHKYGYRNYEIEDQSKNSLKLDLPLMGELYQNNHHRTGHKLNFAHKWYELDLTYIFSLPLIRMRIITPMKDAL